MTKIHKRGFFSEKISDWKLRSYGNSESTNRVKSLLEKVAVSPLPMRKSVAIFCSSNFKFNLERKAHIIQLFMADEDALI